MRIAELDLASLTPVQKMELADVLYDTAQQEFDAATNPLSESQKQEIQRRLAELDSGKVQCVPWEQLHDQLMQGL